ncbi:MAG: quinol:electron acceptor oxidoreductase subunit ActD [Candidatus Walczuchella monophlebidarum]
MTIFCLTYLIRCGLFPCAYPKNPETRTTDDKFLIEIKTKTDVNELVKQFQENGAIEISVKDKP